MIEMYVANAADTKVKYMQADDGRPFEAVVAHLTERDWNVTDPQARLDAATQELGPITERNWRDAQWFIDAKRNTAALLVFRPSKFQRAGATS